MFRAFMAVYLGWRFLVEFIKPREMLVGALSAIQVACLVGFVVSVWLLWRARVTVDGGAAGVRGSDGASPSRVAC